jgi:GNAT superfamily N-acetyltransferase
MAAARYYIISFDPQLLQLERVHRWLAGTYWSPNVRRDVFERAVANSVCVGAYVQESSGQTQVGFARAVTDRATFAWLADVYVDESHRGRGLARRMVRALLDHPELQTLRRWLLATRDAHGVYAALGFHPLPEPQRWMTLQPPPDRWQ